MSLTRRGFLATSAAASLVPAGARADGHLSGLAGYPYPQGLEKMVISHVTSLEATGEGTLSAALHPEIPEDVWNIVVFDVGGSIEITGDNYLTAWRPRTILAGETAPGGIEIRGRPFMLRTDHFVGSHIRSRSNHDDGLKVVNASNWRLENVSTAFSRDEMISIDAREGIIQSWCVVDSLFGFPMRDGDRNHAFGPLVLDNGYKGGFYRCAMIGGRRRMIGVDSRSLPVVHSCLIVSPGRRFRNHITRHPTHFLPKENKPGPMGVDISNTVAIWRPTMGTDGFVANTLDEDHPAFSVPAQIYRSNNSVVSSWRGRLKPEPRARSYPWKTERDTPTYEPSERLIPADQVRNWVPRHAGALPAERDRVDRMMWEEAFNLDVRSRDRPVYWEQKSPQKRAFTPVDGWESIGEGGRPKILSQLNEMHVAVGGADRWG